MLIIVEDEGDKQVPPATFSRVVNAIMLFLYIASRADAKVDSGALRAERTLIAM